MSKVISLLVRASGMSEFDIRQIISTAPSRYKTYTIPKRSGGERVIAQPAREVKFLQRILINEILSNLPVHRAAMAYCEGKSIKDNAAAHVKNSSILKFDFSDFFPSIVSEDWHTYCQDNNVFKDIDDIELSSKILFHKKKHGSVLRLAIGAPSSPLLSNIIMFKFDQLVTEAVSRDKVSYTRYADDLTFSAKRAGNLKNVDRQLRNIIKEILSPRLRVNEEKTVFSTKKYRRVVTGLVLTDDGEVSLGRDRKRLIRSMIHHYALGHLNKDQIEHLAGMLSFVNDVEPMFVKRLTDKYGHAIIFDLKSMHFRTLTPPV
jgi:retron-type reverse transcriptase